MGLIASEPPRDREYVYRTRDAGQFSAASDV